MDMNAARISAPWAGRDDSCCIIRIAGAALATGFPAQASRRSTTNAVTAMSAAARARKMPVSMPWKVQ